MERNGPTYQASCADARECLSDLLDARRGEPLPAGVSPLSDPERFAAVERHVDSCAECRAALDELGELGAAFSEFSVDERAPQDFAHYAAAVRARAGAEKKSESNDAVFPRLVLDAPASSAAPAEKRPVVSLGWRPWLAMTASSVAAAVLCVVGLAMFMGRQAVPAGVAQANIPEPGVVASNDVDSNLSDAAPVPEVNIRPLDIDLAALGNQPPSREFLLQLERDMQRFGVARIPEVRALLGVDLGVASAAAPSAEGEPAGPVVAGVLPGSAAERAGLQRGDRLMKINGIEFKSNTLNEALVLRHVLQYLNEKRPGEPVEIYYGRRGNSAGNTAGEEALWKLRRGVAVLGPAQP